MEFDQATDPVLRKKHEKGECMIRFKNKTALVTGASSGIGLEIARQLAAQGCHLILVARSTEKLNTLRTEIENQYPDLSVRVITMDLAIPEAAERLFGEVSEKTVDILINNAGYGMQGVFLDIPLEKHMHLLQVNLLTLTALTHLFAAKMRERGEGHIMLVSSFGGYMPVNQFAVYTASKAYVLHLGEAIHHELKPHGVTLTVLSPGGTATNFSEVAGQSLNAIGKLSLMSAEKCARIGLSALKKGKPSVVAGMSNKIAVILVRTLPRSWQPLVSKTFLSMGQHR